MTKLGEAAGARDVATTIWMLNESQIQAMSGNTLSVSNPYYITGHGSYWWSVQGAEQTIENVVPELTQAVSGAVSLSRVADSMTFVVSAHDNNGDDYTFTNPSKTDQFNTSNLTAAIGYETGVSETVNWTWDCISIRDNAAVLFNIGPAATSDYTARKGETGVEITHTLTADGITSQTLNAEAVTLASQAGQVATIDFTDTITTSGEYDLVLGDGVGTETFKIQYNVIGLPSNTLLKDGAALASLADVKLTVLDASGTRLDRQTGLTTDADGLTGVTPVAAGAVDDPVEVSFFSPGSEVGIVYETTLGLL
jgi:hypothetical protein